MTRLQAFRAGLLDDPDFAYEEGRKGEGVLDISGVLDTQEPTDLAQLQDWERAAGAGQVAVDTEPALYLVRVGWRDEDGVARQCSGVVGATRPAKSILSQPATTVVVDAAFDELLIPEGVPLVRGTDRGGRHYRVWPQRRPGVIETIAGAVDRLAPATASPFVLVTTDFFLLPPGFLFFLPQDAPTAGSGQAG